MMAEKISEMTNEELKDEYIAVCETIDKIGCFGTRDLRWRDAIEREILKRGGEINPEVSVEFPEMEEEEDEDQA